VSEEANGRNGSGAAAPATAGPGADGGGEERRTFQLVRPAASREEAAAIVAGIERFLRATGPLPDAPAEAADGWRRAAILEGVARGDEGDLPDPWINT
jgi:hypothetical protein